MKRLLFFFCSIACFLIFTSCETNVIDGVQYIQGPGDCIECSASWNNEIVSLMRDSEISFKSQLNGTLELEYYNNAYWDDYYSEYYDVAGFIIYANGNKVGEYTSASRNGLFTPISIPSSSSDFTQLVNIIAIIANKIIFFIIVIIKIPNLG